MNERKKERKLVGKRERKKTKRPINTKQFVFLVWYFCDQNNTTIECLHD